MIKLVIEPSLESFAITAPKDGMIAINDFDIKFKLTPQISTIGLRHFL